MPDKTLQLIWNIWTSSKLWQPWEKKFSQEISSHGTTCIPAKNSAVQLTNNLQSNCSKVFRRAQYQNCFGQNIWTSQDSICAWQNKPISRSEIFGQAPNSNNLDKEFSPKKKAAREQHALLTNNLQSNWQIICSPIAQSIWTSSISKLLRARIFQQQIKQKAHTMHAW